MTTRDTSAPKEARWSTISNGAARSRPGVDRDREAGLALRPRPGAQDADLIGQERPRAAKLAEDPRPDARPARALARLSREPRRELVVGRLPDPRGMRLPDVGATAHDDVDAGRSGDPHERRGRPADPVLGQVDQRSPACRLEPSKLADRDALAAEVDVVRVGRPVLADPAEVGQRQPLVETPGRHAGRVGSTAGRAGARAAGALRRGLRARPARAPS